MEPTSLSMEQRVHSLKPSNETKQSMIKLTIGNHNSHSAPIHFHHRYERYEVSKAQQPTHELGPDVCQLM